MAGTGFVQGFNVGFNAVNSALRLAQLKEESDRRNKREDEKWGYEKGELDRKKNLLEDLKSAPAEPTSGVVVGEAGSRNFADSPDEQAFLRDQDAAIADLQGTKPSAAKIAVGAGRNILDPSDPRAQTGRRGYAARVSDAYRKAGEVDKAFSVEDVQRQFERTRLKDATQYLFASRGDAAGTQRIWEEANGPLGGTLVAEPSVRKGADGTEIPDYALSVRDEQGNVRKLGSGFTMLYMADNPAEYHKLIQGEQKSAADSKRADAKLALEERRVAATEQNANTMEAYRRDQEAARRAGGGSGEAQPFQYTAPSTSDQKAIRETVMENLQEGQDPNVASDVATRLVMANPGMTIAEASRIATDPGATIRNVNTPYGVMPAIVGSDGQARVLAPSAASMQVPREQAPKEEPSATAQAVDKFIDKAKGVGSALVTPRDRSKEPSPTAPASIAAQPPKREQPPPAIYQNAVNALRAERQRLIDQAKSAPPEQQEGLLRQAQALEEQIQRTIATRGVK